MLCYYRWYSMIHKNPQCVLVHANKKVYQHKYTFLRRKGQYTIDRKRFVGNNSFLRCAKDIQYIHTFIHRCYVGCIKFVFALLLIKYLISINFQGITHLPYLLIIIKTFESNYIGLSPCQTSILVPSSSIPTRRSERMLV